MARSWYSNLYLFLSKRSILALGKSLGLVYSYNVCRRLSFNWDFWLFFKWNQFAKKQKASYNDTVERLTKDVNNSTRFKDEEKPNIIAERKVELRDEYIPKVNENKAQINSWIIFFPFSMIRYIFNNLLADFFEMLRNRLTGTLNRIAGSHFDNA